MEPLLIASVFLHHQLTVFQISSLFVKWTYIYIEKLTGANGTNCPIQQKSQEFKVLENKDAAEGQWRFLRDGLRGPCSEGTGILIFSLIL